MTGRRRIDPALTAEEAADLHQAMVRMNAQAIRDLTGAINAQRNRRFKQTYAPCWRRLRDLLAQHRSSLPARLYALLIENSGTTSAVVASYGVMADLLECSPRSVVRAAQVLVDSNAVRRFQHGGDGTAYCWALNPDEVWGGWAGGKEIAPYHTLTLVPMGGEDDPVAVQRAVPTLLPRPKRKSRKPVRCSAAVVEAAHDLA